MFEKLPGKVRVVEVGPRDGLQNEPDTVSTADKVRLITALADAGLKDIEVTSFVSPKWIPQLADALELARSLDLPDSITTSALVPNMRGYERFVESGLKKAALFMSATESHSRKNINKTVEEALTTLETVAARARSDGFALRLYLSVVFECPYEGSVDPDQVMRLTEKLVNMGVDEISYGDTIGAATPDQVLELVKRAAAHFDLERLALHFHDTRGTALANVVAGLESGITTFDASVGGLGGCPYAPGAAGNLASEDLVYMLHGMGIDTGIDLDRLVDAGSLAQEILGRPLPGRYLKASLARRAKGCPADSDCASADTGTDRQKADGSKADPQEPGGTGKPAGRLSRESSGRTGSR